MSGRALRPWRAWADRFHTRQGHFSDAFLRIGPLQFHLTDMPSEGRRYRVSLPRVTFEVWW